MRILKSQREALAYLQDRRAPPQVVKAFGDLIEEAEAVYQTQNDGLFQGAPGGQLVSSTPPPPYRNLNTSYLAPFVVGQNSQQVVPQNFSRTSLVIQNLSGTSVLFINFGSGAGVNNGLSLTAGQGIVLDNECPNDSINVFYDNIAPQPGVILEVRRSS